MKRISSSHGAASAIGLALMVAAFPEVVQAQESPKPAEQAGANDIVVTAQRRNEKLQNVPIQVAAFSEKMISDAGIKSTQDFVNLIPNVSLDQSFTYLNSFVVVRGVAQINNADSPVAVIVDGVPQNSQKQLRMSLFDIERIEVLKGPQGGLYGRNAIGGAMNIITKGPGDHFEGAVEGSYGRGDSIDVNGAISTPIDDWGGLRIAGDYKHDGGRIRNTFTGKNVDFVDHDWELRGKFTASLSAAVNLDLRASYRKFQAGGIYDSVVFSGKADDYQLPNENITGLTWGHIFDTSAKLDFDLGPATLTGITGYTDLTEIYRGDLDFSNPVTKPGGFLGLGIQVGQGQDLHVKLASQEVRLVSNGQGAFRWILGGFYLNTKRDLTTRAFVDLNSSIDQIDNPALVILNLQERNNNNAYAAYATVDYDLAQNLTLSGSLRYDRDDRQQTDPVTGVVRSTSFDEVQPKATLTYKFASDQLAYATYSTGFRSGGFNAPTVAIPVYKAEKLRNFEAGFKTSWLNRRVVFNGAIYKSIDDNFQFFYIDASSASQIIGNIDRVSIWGVELEAQARIGKGLTVYAGIGTADTQIDRNAALPATVGNHTPKSTPFSSNIGVQYETRVSGNVNFLTRADYAHKGRKYWQVTNVDSQHPIDLLDVRVGVETPSWSLFLTGRNILNQKYYADFNPTVFSGLDTAIGFRGQPATWAIESRIKF